ncbi:acyltransferase family protein [Sediminicoccus sp. BL-A-41-H5]|uniref:acyltransferase family protein n=1 Tax=Sediminicoccus sp. BL-A-41-H5 TaxID=3421106 RepID=UPI003D671AE4
MAAAQPILSIQYLRGVAALMIVLYHLGLPLARLGHGGDWPEGLRHGVDLFFVISGFIMVVATRDPALTPGTFLLRRFLRIAPLYYVLTGFLLVVFAIRPALLQSFVFEWPHVLASFAFWPATHPVTGEAEPVLIPGWTLQYEMFFYLLFALAMPAGRWSLAALAAMFLALVGLGQMLQGGVAFTFFTAPLILQFLMGVALGRAHERGWLTPGAAGRRWRWAVAAGAALAMAALVFLPPALPGPWAALESGAWASVIVGALVWLERAEWMPDWRWLLLAGDASYAIYLSHPSVLSAMQQGWQRAGLPPDLITFGVAAVFASVAVGLFLHAAVELPLRRRLRRPAPQRSSIA